MLGGVRGEPLEEREPEQCRGGGGGREEQRQGEGRDFRLGKEVCLRFLIAQRVSNNSTLLPRFVRMELIHVKHLE